MWNTQNQPLDSMIVFSVDWLAFGVFAKSQPVFSERTGDISFPFNRSSVRAVCNYSSAMRLTRSECRAAISSISVRSVLKLYSSHWPSLAETSFHAHCQSARSVPKGKQRRRRAGRLPKKIASEDFPCKAPIPRSLIKAGYSAPVKFRKLAMKSIKSPRLTGDASMFHF